jgi:predicted nicotinamide N-methyase
MSGSPAPHNLYTYDEDGALVDHVAPYLKQGLHEREAMVLVVDPRKRELLRHALADLAGYLPPRPGHPGGAGLWVARQMTRRLEMTSSSRGLTTRLWA